TARTLLLTLRARADEQDRDDPLFADSWSKDWIEFLPEYPDLNHWYETNATFRVATVVRTRLIDEAVRNWLKGKKKALVVELGAGLSTRYFRIDPQNATWVEQDLDKAIALRNKFDMAIDEHWFLSGDFTALDWIERLPESKPENTLFIAEGVLMFADPEGVARLFNALREQYPGAGFIFDVVNPGYIQRAADDFAGMQAPMRWGVTEDELTNYGVTVKDRTHLLLEFPDRWDEIGITADKRSAARSGYVVVAELA
ncbi:MAG: class I SAM-dependent methyltransferase, partial [Anaerolineae bacterium]|nr:class I SAM-dependent methyltransferase [Anaerolineae bacterium]